MSSNQKSRPAGEQGQCDGRMPGSAGNALLDERVRAESAGVSAADPDDGAGALVQRHSDAKSSVESEVTQSCLVCSLGGDESAGAGAGPPGVSAEGPDDAMNEIEDWTTVLEKVLSAGSVANHNLPDIHLELESTSGYVYCPLRVREDQDRVHQQVHACGLFADVRPIGSGGGTFKEHPWRHMEPYKTCFTWQVREFQLGTTSRQVYGTLRCFRATHRAAKVLTVRNKRDLPECLFFDPRISGKKIQQLRVMDCVMSMVAGLASWVDCSVACSAGTPRSQSSRTLCYIGGCLYGADGSCVTCARPTCASHMIMCFDRTVQRFWTLCMPCFEDEYGPDVWT